MAELFVKDMQNHCFFFGSTVSNTNPRQVYQCVLIKFTVSYRTHGTGTCIYLDKVHFCGFHEDKSSIRPNDLNFLK